MAAAPSLTETKVFGMLERFSRAFTSSDGKQAAACWQVPALVVADTGTMAIASAGQVEEFFGGAARQYQAKGIFGTRPQLEEFRPLTNTIACVRVRRPYLNIDGDDTGTVETSTYIVRADENGEAKICVAVMHGASG